MQRGHDMVIVFPQMFSARHVVRRFSKQKRRAGEKQRGEDDGSGELSAGLHLELGANVSRDLSRIVIHEMTDAVVRNTPELCPVAQRTNRGLFAHWEYPTKTKADDIRESALTERKD
jgi:hypothetical protein